jgi:LDH2 family malate/lactate/ureidoglycolate dehydrogenase
MPTFSKNQLTKLSVEIFKAAGVSREEADIVTEILIDTSLHGIDSHGVRAIPGYIREIKEGKLKPGDPITVLRETPTTAMWNVRDGFGFVAAKKAMQAAIEKAKKQKIGSVGITGTGHIGALYYYSMMAAKEDMIGITLCTDGSNQVAPYGGTKRALSIDPFAVAIPTGKENPIFLDVSTTAAAYGHMKVMEARNQEIPDGWLIREDGSWAHDVSEVDEGNAAMVPFGAHKGYGLVVFIEAFCGGISVGCGAEMKGFQNHVLTAIDVEGYCPAEVFKSRTDSLVRQLRSIPARPGFKEVMVPGEPEHRMAERRAKEGIFVDEPFWRDIVATAENLQLDVNSVLGSTILGSDSS